MENNHNKCFWVSALNPSPAKDTVMQVLATCAYGLQQCITVLDTSGLVLSEAESVEACESLALHCKTYAWLAAKFYCQRLMLFKFRPKFHYVYHMAVQMKEYRLNVWAFTTFSEESFIGKCKTIYCACHGRTVNKRFYERYLLCLALMVKRHADLEKYHSHGAVKI